MSGPGESSSSQNRFPDLGWPHLALGLGIVLVVILLLLRSIGQPDPASVFGLTFYPDLLALEASVATMAVALVITTTRIASIRSLIRPIEWLVEWAGRHVRLVCCLAVLGLGLTSRAFFSGLPISPDEWAHLFQAKLFAAGHISGLLPPDLLDRVLPVPVQGFFFRVNPATGSFISVYWPGWAAWLTPFVALGVDWLASPVAAGIGLFLIASLARTLGSAKAGGIALLLTIASGTFLGNGISLFPTTGYLALNLLFVWLTIRETKRTALAAGLVGGWALILHNPVPGPLFALPWILYLVGRRSRWPRLGATLIGYLPGLAILVGWSILSAGVAGGGAAGSFWVDRLATLVGVPTLNLLAVRLAEIVRLFAWSAPALPLLAILAWRQTADRPYLRLLGLSALVTLGGYLFYPDNQGLGWGDRYFQSAWGVMPILAAVMLARPEAQTLRRFALIGAVIGMYTILPLNLGPIRTFGAVVVDAVIPFNGAALGMTALNAPGGSPPFALYQNDSLLRGPVVLMGYGDASDAQIIARYYPGAIPLASGPWGRTYTLPPR